MNYTLLIYLIIFVLQILNAYGISRLLQRFTKINNILVNFLHGFTIQIGFFGFILMISYFFNASANETFYIFIFWQCFISVLYLINYSYFFIFNNFNWKKILTFLTTLILFCALTILVLYFFNLNKWLAIEPQQLDQKIFKQPLKTVNQEFYYWGYRYFFTTIFNHFGVEYNHFYLNIFINLNFAFLSSIAFYYLFLNKNIFNTFKNQYKNLISYFLGTLLIWMALLFLYIYTSFTTFWVLIVIFNFILLLDKINSYPKSYFSLFFIFTSLSLIWFGLQSLYTICIFFVFVNYNLIKTKNKNLAINFFSSLSVVWFSLLQTFFYRYYLVPDLLFNILRWFVLILFLTTLLFTIFLWKKVVKNPNFALTYKLNALIEKNFVKSVIFLFIVSIFSVVILSIVSDTALVNKILFRILFSASVEKTIQNVYSIIIWVAYFLFFCIYFFYLFLKENKKGLFTNSIKANWFLYLVANPFTYVLYSLIFLIPNNNNNFTDLNITSSLKDPSFLLIPVINGILIFIIKKTNSKIEFN